MPPLHTSGHESQQVRSCGASRVCGGRPVHIADVALELVRIIAAAREPLSPDEIEAMAELLRGHPK